MNTRTTHLVPGLALAMALVTVGWAGPPKFEKLHLPEGAHDCRCVATHGRDRVWIGDAYGRLLLSTDGGRTWEVSFPLKGTEGPYLRSGGSWRAIHVLDERRVWLAGPPPAARLEIGGSRVSAFPPGVHPDTLAPIGPAVTIRASDALSGAHFILWRFGDGRVETDSEFDLATETAWVDIETRHGNPNPILHFSARDYAGNEAQWQYVRMDSSSRRQPVPGTSLGRLENCRFSEREPNRLGSR